MCAILFGIVLGAAHVGIPGIVVFIIIWLMAKFLP